MSDFRSTIRRVIDGKGETHIERKKHRIAFISVTGVLLLLLVFMSMLSIGPTRIINPIEALSPCGS